MDLNYSFKDESAFKIEMQIKSLMGLSGGGNSGRLTFITNPIPPTEG